MITKKYLITTLIFAFLFASAIQAIGNQNNDTTTLEISDIRGGILKVTADIENTGEVTAENFSITLSVKGGLLGLINVTTEDTVDLLEVLATEEICTDRLILGLGRVTITVTAEAANAERVIKTTDGFVILFFVLVA